jgi:hypothetical protein
VLTENNDTEAFGWRLAVDDALPRGRNSVGSKAGTTAGAASVCCNADRGCLLMQGGEEDHTEMLWN